MPCSRSHKLEKGGFLARLNAQQDAAALQAWSAGQHELSHTRGSMPPSPFVSQAQTCAEYSIDVSCLLIKVSSNSPAVLPGNFAYIEGSGSWAG